MFTSVSLKAGTFVGIYLGQIRHLNDGVDNVCFAILPREFSTQNPAGFVFAHTNETVCFDTLEIQL